MCVCFARYSVTARTPGGLTPRHQKHVGPQPARDDMLRTSHKLPVQPVPDSATDAATNHSALTLTHSDRVATFPQSWYRWTKIGLGGLVVAMATFLLRLGTSRLDVLAHGAASLLASPSLLVSAIAGAGAGSLHTLSGPDHLAALTPLAVRVRGGSGAAFRTGVFWGSGHVLGQLLLGIFLLSISRCHLFSNLVSSLGIGALAERAAALAVGLVLLLIGSLGVKEANEWQEEAEQGVNGKENSFTWKTFGTGVLSGMHPDALLLCLPALTLPTNLAAVSYLAAFAAGTLTAMGGYTAAIHSACRALGQRAVRRVSMIASWVAIAVGTAVCGAALGVPLLGGLI